MDMNKFWTITVFEDDGNAETGPHPNSWNDIVVENTAESAWKLANLLYEDSDATPISIRPATEQEIADYLDYMEFEEELREVDKILPW